jgi:hypothetical protein
MENLDKNVLRMLALDLAMPDILKLCLTSKKINSEICKNNNFWRNKLYKDYPQTINKFPGNSDFKRIYLSLYEKVQTQYCVYISSKDKNNIVPKFWDYIKEFTLNDEDFDIAKKLYEDFDIREGEEFCFPMIGDFPKGTKIYLAYISDANFDYKNAFLSREEAISSLMKTIHMILEENYITERDFFVEYWGEPEIFYGGTFEEVINKYKKQLEKEDYVGIIFPAYQEDLIYFIVKEFTI